MKIVMIEREFTFSATFSLPPPSSDLEIPIIQRNAAGGNNSTWLACAPAWDSLLSAFLKWLYIGIEWPKDLNSDAFAHRTVTGSDSTCPADGVSLAMSTLLLIPDRASVHK